MESHKWIRYSGGVTFATLTCLQVTRDYMRDQIDAAALGLVEALDQEIAMAFGLILPSSCLQKLGMNWWGTTKIRMSAFLAASTRSGTATCGIGATK